MSGLDRREVEATIRSARRRAEGSQIAHQLPSAQTSTSIDDDTRDDAGTVLASLLRAPREAERRRPPRRDVDHLWRVSRAPEFEVLRNLSGVPRPGIHAALAVDLDLVRVLPEDAPAPTWARWWQRSGHRVLVPTFDPSGIMVSFRARSLGAPRGNLEKELAPAGFDAGGAVMACPLAVGMFEGDAGCLDQVQHAGLILTEGSPSWIAAASRFSDADGNAPGAIGYFPGAWTRAHAETVPDGARVVLDPDDNEAGRRMVRKIIDSFDGLGARLEIRKEARRG